jgi:LuxR family transcriptional regulator
VAGTLGPIERADADLRSESVDQLQRRCFKRQDEEGLWAELQDVFRDRLGTTSILYGFTHNVHLSNRVGFTRSLVIKHNHPPAYLACFKLEEFLDTDVSAMLLFENCGPFLWSDLDGLPTLTKDHRSRIGVDREFGLNVGVSLGFRFNGGRGVAGIGLASKGLEPREFAELWKAGEKKHIALLTEFDHLMRPIMVGNRLKLTPRCKECLQLSVVGMSAKEIGLQLGITERAVFNTLNRARHSLQAGNTIEAVAKALAYDLI